ncbi:MAG: glycosyltransferase [Bacteroidota bacterium]|nr:glycosyltransferase [Bacteroidota bacterium]
MIHPKISVIIPAYNAERWISDSIVSVLDQLLTDLELIVINDGSTDSTAEIARRIDDPRLRVIDRLNSGVSEARNAGIDLATGEYISFLDADDAMVPDNLLRKIEFLEFSKVHWVFGDLVLCDEDLKPTGTILYGTDEDVLRNVLLGTGKAVPAPCSNIIAHRSCFDQGIRLDPDLSNAADQDLVIALARSYRYAHIPAALNLYRQLPGSMSKNIALYEKDHLHLFSKAVRTGLLNDHGVKRQAMSNAYWAIGGSWWINGGSPLRGIPYLIRSTLLRPSILAEKLFRKGRSIS